MEHRQGKRTNKALAVHFYNQGVSVATGRTRNIASGGVFVETTYQPHKGVRCIEMAFSDGDGFSGRIDPVSALIIHRTKEGFGLMVDDLDPVDSVPLSVHNVRKFEPIDRLSQL